MNGKFVFFIVTHSTYRSYHIEGSKIYKTVLSNKKYFSIISFNCFREILLSRVWTTNSYNSKKIKIFSN